MEQADSVTAGLAAWIRAMPAGVDPEVEAARQRIGRLSRQFEQVLRRAAAAHDLSLGDWQALSALHRSGAPGVLTPKELGDHLGVTSGTVSVRIDRLARAGLVERVPAADGRSRPVRLTAKGRRRWSTATGKRTAHERDLFADALTADQLAVLNPLLGTLLARFETEFGTSSTMDVVRPG
ncbi:MAG TPA: MarR family transcriptional regulator [Streptosporangiaceae bacterium]